MIYDSPETVRIIKSFIEKKLEEKHEREESTNL